MEKIAKTNNNLLKIDTYLPPGRSSNFKKGLMKLKLLFLTFLNTTQISLAQQLSDGLAPATNNFRGINGRVSPVGTLPDRKLATSFGRKTR